MCCSPPEVTSLSANKTLRTGFRPRAEPTAPSPRCFISLWRKLASGLFLSFSHVNPDAVGFVGGQSLSPSIKRAPMSTPTRFLAKENGGERSKERAASSCDG